MCRRLALMAALAVLALAPAAHASDVIVQGTTDVRDAGLLDDVIIPGFHAAYPQYTLKYIAVGTGQALTNAEAGQGDAVLTHAPTLEAQFIAGGYSYQGSGRAVFYSDYVILGPKSDPAGVLTGAPHDAAHAFELIAQAGAAGKASFVSRGDNSGTNVEEKAIWKLTQGVPLNGSGEPTGGWYHKAGLGQADTVRLTDQCPFSGGGCYEITDRGTFNRLVANKALSQLQVVADKNTATSRGGVNLLVNSFHAYAVNPSKVSSANLPGALAFLSYLTSPAFQRRLATYPSAQRPAFFADARPKLTITSKRLPTHVVAGARLTVSGKLASMLPGAAPLAGAVVALQTSHTAAVFTAAVGPPVATMLARAKLRANGQFRISVPAARSGPLQIAFPTSKDLSSATYSLGKISVKARVTLSRARASAAAVRLSGRVLPSTQRDRAAEFVVLGRHPGAGGFHVMTTVGAPARGARFALDVKLSPGKWQLRVQYRDRTVVQPGSSRTVSVSVL
jgi:tungstate transport system substrate-binding protein